MTTTASLNASILANKSTNVRASVPIQQTLLRAAFGTAGTLFPGLSARLAARLFLRTQRSHASEKERAILSSATRFTVGDMTAWSWGQGPVVLLVHGWNGRGSQLGSFVEPLVARGYRVVTFDALGHGESPGNEMSLPWLADAIAQVAEAVGGLHAVIAHSLGAASTTVALSEDLAAERVVLVAPPAEPRGFLSVFAATIGLPEAAEDRAVAHIERRIGRRMSSVRAPVLARGLRAPLLVVHDAEDSVVSWQSGRRIAAAWRGARLMTTRGLGHFRILRDPSVVDAAVAFVDAASSSERAA
jgi:pimeloyl-ACP methyl ester carboxylesterase